MISRDVIKKNLRAQINVNDHIVGAAVGSGMTAKYAALGGADFFLALSAGKYRIMGRSSYGSYFCYSNSNSIVMELGKNELLPIMKDSPVFFGLMANDPFINLYDYIGEIKRSGFSGIVNFPTIALIDGKFGQALREDGNTFEMEVEAIRLAHYMDMFTLGFVTNLDEAKAMIEAGADMICVHLGLTKGGILGAKKYISIDNARSIADNIFQYCDSVNPDIIRTIYSGPANTPVDMEYIYLNTKCQGYIGGSTFDRIPSEKAIVNTVKAFKYYDELDQRDTIAKLINNNWNSNSYVDFVKKYIEDYYMDDILLSDIATVIHVSVPYLSSKFKGEVGCNFTEYLTNYRMNKAMELLSNKNLNCKEVALMVGYKDYAHFSKMFKKHFSFSPREYLKTM